MRKHNFAFIDIETTGLNLRKHEIIEIGVVLTTPTLEIIEEFEIKIKPENIESADPVARLLALVLFVKLNIGVDALPI